VKIKDCLTVSNEGMAWIEPRTCELMRIYGFNWLKTDQVYRRLPLASVSEISRACPLINSLAEKTSGGQIHFRTNSKKIAIRALLKEKPAMSGMTAVTQGGFDCYAGNDYDHLLFYNTARFEPDKTESEFTLFENEPSMKLIVINFPLYVGIEKVMVGLEEDAILEAPEPLNPGRIVIYGTSITQGGCASRPGLSFTNILSRRLKSEFLNFGFSGNAFGEIEIARIMAKIENVKLYILDYEANGGTNGKLALTLEPFIKTIRESHPFVPIAVLSRIKYLFDDLHEEMGIRRQAIRQFQIDTVTKLRNENDANLHFIDGSVLLGDDYSEFTIDSIHPNDLGFMKIANGLETEIIKILNNR
jgi:lysophospholipase L1-like esterase